jgi:hypothetical protein
MSSQLISECVANVCGWVLRVAIFAFFASTIVPYYVGSDISQVTALTMGLVLERVYVAVIFLYTSWCAKNPIS